MPPPPPPQLFLFALIFISTFTNEVRLALGSGHNNKNLKKQEYISGYDKDNKPTSVTFDERSLIINGKRVLIFSGSIHYPRVPVAMWDKILKMARRGGLNCIQTYVFWNVHEPVKGQYHFSGNNDLVKFIKTVADNEMYVTLRVGPFIQAEWNHGGLPYWLREEKDVVFRTDNTAYKKHMQEWVSKIVNMMKDEKLFASQGGPIILSQIENEYDHVIAAFDKGGKNYIKWAGVMAHKLNTSVPWIMCKQKDPPSVVINACNGRHCGDTFNGPKSHKKPKIWTENWTAQYRGFGDPPSMRPAEDIAYSVARWFSKNGSHVNYYMYYGGTNFGRTSAAFVTTRYYDEAPIDEYGLVRFPKYGHLKDLHYALELSKEALLEGVYTVETYNLDTEARIYEKPETDKCVAFLWNNKTRDASFVKFRGKDYSIPPKSISILLDCKTVMYNTKTIAAQHNARLMVKSKTANKSLQWEMTSESMPSSGSNFSMKPLEQYSLTKDTTDYVWYITKIKLDEYDLPFRKAIQPVLQLVSLGHSIMVFANGKYEGTNHGFKASHKFHYGVSVELNEGVNVIAFLQATVGMSDSGAYIEHRFSGLRSLIIQGLGAGNLDLTSNGWHHKVGLEGEEKQFYTEEGSKGAIWVPAIGKSPSLTWFKARFDAPDGELPLAIRMKNMSKGMIWINGNNIGRYWTSFLTPMNRPSQTEYHIPRAFLKPKDNMVVIFDEEGGRVESVEILVVDRSQVCSIVSESYPPHVKSWKRDSETGQIVGTTGDPKPIARVKCPDRYVATAVEFASFGRPWGVCQMLMQDHTCHANNTKKVVEDFCLGKNMCAVPVKRALFEDGDDPCPHDKDKVLAFQLKCTPTTNLSTYLKDVQL